MQLSKYKIMWMMVLFDLPVTGEGEAKRQVFSGKRYWIWVLK